MTVLAPFKADRDDVPAKSSFTITLRVEEIDDIIAALEADGTKVRRLPDDDHGIGAHCANPEGDPIEIWPPPPD
jgi:predicted enzyme related to lactoylglutathione lyase